MKKNSHTYPGNKFEIQTKKKNLGDSTLFINEKHQTSHLQHLRLKGDTSLSSDEMTTQPKYNLTCDGGNICKNSELKIYW